MAKKQLSFLESIEEKYGELVIYDENRDKEKVVAIPTGSISLDISTGVGGIPLGKFTELYGAESSGKSTLAISLAGNAIRLGHKVLYNDVEQSMTYTYIESIIGDFDHSKLVLVQPDTAEDSLQISENAIRSGEFGLIILDSIGSMAPVKVKTDELTDSNVALLSRIMTTFAQRNAAIVRQSGVAFLGINQVRDKIGSYIKEFETPGGHAWKHILSLRIMLSKAQNIEQGEEIVGINARFNIKKNKVGPPFKSFIIPIIFGKGIDSVRDLMNFSETLGVLEKAGSYYRFEGQNLGQGVNNTIEYLQNHPETLDKIKELVYNMTITKKGQNKDGANDISEATV